MNAKKIDVLCDQAIDVALVIKEVNEVINRSYGLHYPSKFMNRVNSVIRYCHAMFVNANANEHTDEEINDLMITLMSTLVNYKNSYNKVSYGYKVMNSLLDIANDTFVKLNS